MTIGENIAEIRRRIDEAARETGRRGADITLVGASKMNGAAACREAIAAGIDALGENRVQEMMQKLGEHAYDGAPLHFIGHLQRNKVRQVVGRAALIQSVGSEALLQEVEKAASRAAEAEAGFVQPILLEVNIGGEASKSGFAPEDLSRAAETALSLPHLRLDGVMTIPPLDADREETRRYFDKVYSLYVDITENLLHNRRKVLSMGMSGDYEDAIRAGATMVRIGSAIFGSRQYQDT